MLIRSGRRGACALVLLCLPLLAGRVEAQKLDPVAHKAGIVFNLVKFARWPDSAFPDKGKKKAPIVIGVIDDSAIAKALERLAKDGYNGRDVQVRKIDDNAETKGYHLIYTASQDSGALSALVRKTAKQPTILVASTESLDALALGIDVNLVPKKLRKGNKIVLKLLLEINLKTLKKRSLSIDSRVLRLAQRVVK